MQLKQRSSRFQQFLENFPRSVQEILQTIPPAGGMLSAEYCPAVRETMEISTRDLMQRLLPLAKLYSAAEISGFQVGAVAKARMSNKADDSALFLGANIEFPGQALNQTIHAEQSAVINAWLQGAGQFEVMAVSEAPCGCCRQFLYELQGSQDLMIMIQNLHEEKTAIFDLPALLPQAFGPHELGSHSGLMAHPARLPDLRLRLSSQDSFVLEALTAARKSYAPYSHNLAGCAIQAGRHKIYTGAYIENAAFNPSLSPLQTALVRLVMDNLESDSIITKAVLVEKPTSISQRAICELLLRTVAPNVKLEYEEAR